MHFLSFQKYILSVPVLFLKALLYSSYLAKNERWIPHIAPKRATHGHRRDPMSFCLWNRKYFISDMLTINKKNRYVIKQE